MGVAKKERVTVYRASHFEPFVGMTPKLVVTESAQTRILPKRPRLSNLKLNINPRRGARKQKELKNAAKKPLVKPQMFPDINQYNFGRVISPIEEEPRPHFGEVLKEKPVAFMEDVFNKEKPEKESLMFLPGAALDEEGHFPIKHLTANEYPSAHHRASSGSFIIVDHVVPFVGAHVTPHTAEELAPKTPIWPPKRTIIPITNRRTLANIERMKTQQFARIKAAEDEEKEYYAKMLAKFLTPQHEPKPAAPRTMYRRRIGLNPYSLPISAPKDPWQKDPWLKDTGQLTLRDRTAPPTPILGNPNPQKTVPQVKSLPKILGGGTTLTSRQAPITAMPPATNVPRRLQQVTARIYQAEYRKSTGQDTPSVSLPDIVPQEIPHRYRNPPKPHKKCTAPKIPVLPPVPI